MSSEYERVYWVSGLVRVRVRECASVSFCIKFYEFNSFDKIQI